jgi:hypothetical protein
MFHKKQSKTAISNAKRKFGFFFWEGLNCRILTLNYQKNTWKISQNFDLINCKIITFEVKK